MQLATGTSNEQTVGNFPWVRWYQTFDVGYVPNNVVPQMFMAVRCDLRDDPNGVHTRYKHDVAHGKQVEFQGPIVESVTYTSGAATVNITYTAVSSLELRSTQGFDVCCQGSQCLNDTIWIPVNVSNKDGLKVTIRLFFFSDRNSVAEHD